MGITALEISSDFDPALFEEDYLFFAEVVFNSLTEHTHILETKLFTE